MSTSIKSALGLAALALAASTAMPASAADLYGGGRRGSIKDDYVASAPRSPAGNCYMRADVGYGITTTPNVRWAVTDPNTNDFVTDNVTNIHTQNRWLVEGGFGCGTGGWSGWRGEVMLGYRGSHEIKGEPGLWAPTTPITGDPLHVDITTYTTMVNVYRDLGNWGGFTPYLGAGIGLAYHVMDNVYFTENPNLVNQIEGNRDLAFAWQLMAGVGYQLTDRAVLDFGYRYVDLGKATSGRADTAFFVNPRVTVDDLAAHEFKVGMRYSFGAADHGYMPMK